MKKLYVDCFKDYLVENNYPQLAKIATSDLNDVLKNFYSEVRKKKTNPDDSDAETSCKKRIQLYEHQGCVGKVY